MKRKLFEVNKYNDLDPMPEPDIAICSQCGWRGPIASDEATLERDWEDGYCVDLCPICDDGGCIDDYDFSTVEKAKEWEEWFERKARTTGQT